MSNTNPPDAIVLDEPGTCIVKLVHARSFSPVALAQSTLARIRERNPHINAFRLVLAQQAIAQATALEKRSDLETLPLAGVPIAIKDNLDFEGVPTRRGSSATNDAPAKSHHEIVRRVLAAGAIVIGKTAMPELGLWGTTDGAWGITRNPWNLSRTPGGSSGGSAAAVAAGMASMALGDDGLGSIRIPAACCGLVGIKPGEGLVPRELGPSDWTGFSENGTLATTVADAALLLAVIAGRPSLGVVRESERPLRVALSTKAPGPGLAVDLEHAGAANDVAALMQRLGHKVETADPPYSLGFAAASIGNWCAATSSEIGGADASKIEARTRVHARGAPIANWMKLTDKRWRADWRRKCASIFDRFDLLLTPTLALPPIAANSWHKRSWITNLVNNTRYAPFCASWNLAGYAALSVPAGMHSDGTPIGVQLIAPPGRESVLIGIALTIERLRPWVRLTPLKLRA